MKPGVLALQGDVREHLQLLRDIGSPAHSVRTQQDLENVDALVIPGGESTTIGFMLAEHGMIEPLRKRVEDGMPVFGTCAGAILLAREVLAGDVRKQWPTIGVLDVTIERNAYGRQVDSFEGDVDVDGIGSVRAILSGPRDHGGRLDVTVLASQNDHPASCARAHLAATLSPS